MREKPAPIQPIVYLNFGRIASALKIEAELTNSSVDLFFLPAQVGVD